MDTLLYLVLVIGGLTLGGSLLTMCLCWIFSSNPTPIFTVSLFSSIIGLGLIFAGGPIGFFFYSCGAVIFDVALIFKAYHL